ncbi:ABC transporter ATP-binding protein [Glycomyces buryatensis]|uniref:ABC transporter ATP-binding protein n=1 Tax=Glycomyces buryatensis TaxID=2570927 RepID=A0A4S8QJ53_9ACTN|nr:ABC transporter ATP-binding protein [Glycomyces buryatensis]THV40764.1 ABC transporter ATP-binding protein [Glycomyces buryatensis]
MLDKIKAGWRGYRDSLAIGYRAHPKGVIAQIVLGLAEALLIPIALYLIKVMIDAVQTGDSQQAYLAAASLGLAVGVIWAVVFAYVKVIFTVLHHTVRVADRRIMELMGNPPGLDHHERSDYLDRVQRIREDRWLLGGCINQTAQMLRAVLVIVFGGAMLAQVHPLLLVFPLITLAGMTIARRAGAIEEDYLERTSAAERRRRHLFEVATGTDAGKELRIFGSAGELGARHSAAGRGVVAERNRGQWKAARLASWEGVISAFGMASGIGFVLYLAIRGQATAGDVILLVGLIQIIAGYAAGLTMHTVLVYKTAKLGARLEWLRKYGEASAGPARPVETPERLSNGIVLEDVSFAYPESKRPSLDGVSLELPAGKVVALVGENGAGKTTLVKLLSGFYQPTGGQILVDGQDLTGFGVASWRQRIGATFQDLARFEFTARETIGVGDLGAGFDDERVREAMARAGAGDVIEDLPGGLDTRLGGRWDDGTDLSGGQWQKLAIGRGRMREEPLLVLFDEPTAALDPQTEHALFEQFAEEVRAGRQRGTVTVLVSHRFSTVSMADLIVVLDQGRVAETGTHKELMERRGAYAELYELQSSAYR